MSSLRITLASGSIAALLAWSLASCAPDAPPASEGIGPANSVSSSGEERQPLDLARPDPVAEPSQQAPPAPPPPVVVPEAPIGPDIADLGPFDVLTWDESRARAAQQIKPETAAAELERLRAELENQP